MCLVAVSILYFGYVDLQEGNVAWMNSGPDYEPKGNVAIRSVWGVVALLLSPIAFLLLFGLVMYRVAIYYLVSHEAMAIGARGTLESYNCSDYVLRDRRRVPLSSSYSLPSKTAG